MPETTLPPIYLESAQSAFVERVVQGPTPIQVLVGAPGTGKTVTLVAAVAAVARAREGARLLVVVPDKAAAEMIAARLDGEIDGVPVVNLNKALYREHAVKGAHPWSDPSIVVAAEHLVGQPDVAATFAEVGWDMIALESGMKVHLLGKSGGASVAFADGMPIPASLVAIVIEEFQGIGEPPALRAVDPKLVTLTKLESRFGRVQDRIALEVIPYRRSESEVDLLEKAFELARTVPDEVFGMRLLWASTSSFAALSQELLQQRNHLVHGLESSVDDFQPASWLSVVRTVPALPVPVGQTVALLMRLADDVDQQDRDSKLDALSASLLDGKIPLPAAVFASNPATHRYLQSALGDLGLPLHVVTPRSGDADSDFAALHAFAEKGGVLLAPPDRLKGVELNAAAGVAFDMPLSTGAMMVLMTRLYGRAAERKTLFALFDDSRALPPEQRALERYGFIPISGEAAESGLSDDS